MIIMENLIPKVFWQSKAEFKFDFFRDLCSSTRDGWVREVSSKRHMLTLRWFSFFSCFLCFLNASDTTDSADTSDATDATAAFYCQEDQQEILFRWKRWPSCTRSHFAWRRETAKTSSNAFPPSEKTGHTKKNKKKKTGRLIREQIACNSSDTNETFSRPYLT